MLPEIWADRWISLWMTPRMSARDGDTTIIACFIYWFTWQVKNLAILKLPAEGETQNDA